MKNKYLLHALYKLGLGLLLTLTVSAAEPTTPGNRVPLPHPPPAKMTIAATQSCVEPIATIRRFHGQYLKHQRDETMHRGIRTSKYNLVECINCHVTPNSEGKYPNINTSEHFCGSCHNYAAVTIDCFQCHASVPEMAPSPSQTKVNKLTPEALGTSSTTQP